MLHQQPQQSVEEERAGPCHSGQDGKPNPNPTLTTAGRRYLKARRPSGTWACWPAGDISTSLRRWWWWGESDSGGLLPQWMQLQASCLGARCQMHGLA